MTTTTFTDGVTPVVANWLNDVDAAVYETLPNHIADTLDAHAASAITNIPAGNLIATDVQAALNELDTEKQPVDAELTALAGLTSAANKVPRFTGSGTAEVIDVEYGTYTPTFSNFGNVTSITSTAARYVRIGSTVQVYAEMAVTPTAAAGYQWNTSLPIASTSALVMGHAISSTTNGGEQGNVTGPLSGEAYTIMTACTSTTQKTVILQFSYEV